MDPGPGRAAGPFSGLGLSRRIAPRTRRAVGFPGRRNEWFGSGSRVPGGLAPGKGPYVDVELR